MKKTLKIFITVAILALALCAVAFMSTAESAKPTIVSTNIAYEGNYGMLIAVDAQTVTGNSVTVKVWSADDKSDLIDYPATEAEADAYIGNGTYYKVHTNNIAQKDIDKVYKYQAVDANGVEGDVMEYSVIKYFFIRLFGMDFVNAEESNAADYARKQLYIKTIEQAALAQDVLLNHNSDQSDNREVLADDLFCYADMDNKTVEVIQPTNDGKVLPAFDERKIPEGQKFAGYEVTTYGKDYVAAAPAIMQAGDTVEVNAHTVVKATFTEKAFEFGKGEYYNNADIAGTRSDYETVSNYGSGAASGDTVSTDTGKLVFTRAGGTGDSYIQFVHSNFPGTPNEPVHVFETDFMFTGYKADVEAGGRIGRFDFRAKGLLKEIYITAEAFGADNVITTIKLGSIELEADKWYNIGFVLNYNNNTIEYFRDGVSVGTDEIGTRANDGTKSCWFFENAQTAGSMNFDNTLIACYDANPPVGGDYFQNTDIDGIRMNGDDLLSSVQASDLGALDTLTMVDGKLVFERNNASGGTYFRWVHSGVPNGMETPVMVFEADITFADIAVSSGYRPIYFYVTGNNKEVVTEVQFSGQDIYIRSGSGNVATLKMGQKNNIRLEVDYATGQVSYYINGDFIKTDTPYGYNDKSGSNYVRFDFASAATAGTITIDNVFIGMVEEGTATN